MNELPIIQTTLTHRILRFNFSNQYDSDPPLKRVLRSPSVEGKSMVKFHPPHERWLKNPETKCNCLEPTFLLGRIKVTFQKILNESHGKKVGK